eukprot:10262487-Karenia_brevis.AAC.1
MQMLEASSRTATEKASTSTDFHSRPMIFLSVLDPSVGVGACFGRWPGACRKEGLNGPPK